MFVDPKPVMNYFTAFILIVFFQHSIVGQNKAPDEFVVFKDVWIIENSNDLMEFKAGGTGASLLFRIVFNKNKILSFSMDLNYTCPCTPALERENEVTYITTTGSHLYYRADYIYTKFTFESPKKKLLIQTIPVELWINRVNHKLKLKIDNKSITKYETNFYHSSGINIISHKNGTSLPSAASIQ